MRFLKSYFALVICALIALFLILSLDSTHAEETPPPKNNPEIVSFNTVHDIFFNNREFLILQETKVDRNSLDLIKKQYEYYGFDVLHTLKHANSLVSYYIGKWKYKKADLYIDPSLKDKADTFEAFITSVEDITGVKFNIIWENNVDLTNFSSPSSLIGSISIIDQRYEEKSFAHYYRSERIIHGKEYKSLIQPPQDCIYCSKDKEMFDHFYERTEYKKFIFYSIIAKNFGFLPPYNGSYNLYAWPHSIKSSTCVVDEETSFPLETCLLKAMGLTHHPRTHSADEWIEDKNMWVFYLQRLYSNDFPFNPRGDFREYQKRLLRYFESYQ